MTRIAPSLQPVAHALLQALEELERITPALHQEDLRAEPGGAASLWFHYVHLAGSLDRLLTYARGEPLSADQQARMAIERGDAPAADAPADDAPPAPATPAALLAHIREVIASAIEQLRDTPESELDEFRGVGRAGHPSTVRGLLFHAAEHTARHVGQIATTARVLGRLG